MECRPVKSRHQGIWVITLSTIVSWLGMGCQTSGGLDKTEHFADYGGNGNANYYRVSIQGSGHNGVVNYRSGWYDAKAVDALFGTIGTDANVKAKTAQRQQKAVTRTYNKYMEALEQDEKFEQVEVYKSKYEEALRSITGVSEAGEGPLGSLDHSNEKFVMILANDPDEIIEAIRNNLQTIDFTSTITNLFAERQATEQAKAHLGLSLLAGRLEALQGSLNTSKDKLNDAQKNQALLAELDLLLAEVEAAE